MHAAIYQLGTTFHLFLTNMKVFNVSQKLKCCKIIISHQCQILYTVLAELLLPGRNSDSLYFLLVCPFWVTRQSPRKPTVRTLHPERNMSCALSCTHTVHIPVMYIRQEAVFVSPELYAFEALLARDTEA